MAVAPQPEFDLLLKGGHLIDPKNRINGLRDIAIKDGRIVAVSADLPAAKALKTLDLSGLYVTPGLVDIHVHVYAGTGMRGAYCGDLSVYPDGHTFRSGVTTVVDAGSSGWRNFPDFKDRVIDRARTRVLAMLNIVGRGMGGGKIEQDTSDMDPKATAEMALRFKELVVGIKTAHYAAPDWIAVDRAIEAGRLAGLPVMVDFGSFLPERPFQKLVLEKLRPGDIYTHTYLAAVPMLDEEGQVLPYLFAARKRGVLFDLGHGAGSFVFRQAAPALRQEFPPDTISTDLHVSSMNAGMKDMLNVMSKMLNLGMPLEEVILRSTWRPAQVIHREELGHLSVGATADVAVLNLRYGSFGFVDVYGARLRGNRKLEAELTIREGKVVWDLNGLTREDWNRLPRNYGPQGDRRWDGTIGGSSSRPQR